MWRKWKFTWTTTLPIKAHQSMRKIQLKDKLCNTWSFIHISTWLFFLLSLKINLKPDNTSLVTAIKKKYAMKYFKDLKIDTSSSNNFYCEFICRALEPEYMSKILIEKFKYKQISCFQDKLKSEVELLTAILASTKQCLYINKQMPVTDRIIYRTTP